MTPLVRKEIRLLLPAWVAALVTATLPLWQWRELQGVSPGFFFVAILALCLSPFGQETSHGTFGLLLVQPEERRRFWRIKTGLLAVALMLPWALFTVCVWNSPDRLNRSDWDMWLKWSALLAFLAFSGGLWTTLLLRDMVSAFFCTWLIPAFIAAATLASISHWFNLNINHDSDRATVILFCVLAVYAVAGIMWARWLFMRAQDVPWTGGQISLTAVRGVSLRWLAFEFKGRQNRWTALVKKELQLQEVTMALIPLLALLHLAVLTLCYCHPQWSENELLSVIVPIIWLAAVPMVIGCVAVAEERRLNTLESFLCLPLRKRVLFDMKLAVALVLGIVLGGVIPWVLLHMAGTHAFTNFPFYIAVTSAAAITGLAFYASTMSRGMLQALPTTLCIPALLGMEGYLFFNNAGDSNLLLGRSLLYPALILPAMAVTFVRLGFKNYQQLQIGWRVWVGNLIRGGAIFGCVTLAATAIYDRSWELFEPLEPHHGPARISGTGRAGMGAWGWSDLCVLLPDGRLWIGEKNSSWKSIPGRFVPGSNWVQVAANQDTKYVVALRSNGTLWKIRNGSDMRQIGSDTDWKKIVASATLFLALKQDGTIWGWGRDYSAILKQEARSVRYADPVRVRDDADWVDVFVPRHGQAMGIKRDGSTWTWGYAQYGPTGLQSSATHQLVRGNLEGTNWSAIASTWNYTLGIRNDGSIWAAGKVPANLFGENVRASWHPQAVRIGTKSDWVALNGSWLDSAIEADGTLWTIEFDKSKRPSKYNDWLAATEDYQFTWGLAKDGTISCWNVFGIEGHDAYAPFMEDLFPLGATRGPILSGNIFTEQK